MAANPFNIVSLRAEITIDGVPYTYQESMPRRDWEAIERDPLLMLTVENMMRAKLGAFVMGQLQPPVHAIDPSRLDETEPKPGT